MSKRTQWVKSKKKKKKRKKEEKDVIVGISGNTQYYEMYRDDSVTATQKRETSQKLLWLI
jgi:hypothetical protein